MRHAGLPVMRSDADTVRDGQDSASVHETTLNSPSCHFDTFPAYSGNLLHASSIPTLSTQRRFLMLSRYIFSAVLFFLLTLTSLQAQQRDIIVNTLGIGPRTGWYASNAADEGAWYFGVAGRLRLGKNVGFEAAIDYRVAERFPAGSLDERAFTADVAYMPLTLSAMLFMPFGAYLSPYGIAGLGWYYTFVDYNVMSSSIPELQNKFRDENSFVPGYHFGLGCEVVFSQHFTIHGEFRYLFLGTEIKKLKDITTLDIDTRTSNGIMFSFGFMVYM
jgi:opacity protein-like surface antigen